MFPKNPSAQSGYQILSWEAFLHSSNFSLLRVSNLDSFLIRWKNAQKYPLGLRSWEKGMEKRFQSSVLWWQGEENRLKKWRIHFRYHPAPSSFTLEPTWHSLTTFSVRNIWWPWCSWDTAVCWQPAFPCSLQKTQSVFPWFSQNFFFCGLLFSLTLSTMPARGWLGQRFWSWYLHWHTGQLLSPPWWVPVLCSDAISAEGVATVQAQGLCQKLQADGVGQLPLKVYLC